jgi:glycerate-2-kinase
LAHEVAQARPRDEVWVLLSGGASSLIGAPIVGVSPTEYMVLIRALGEAGLPIGELNRVRKRFSQWGAGRLAIALGGTRLRLFALSDVSGDDLADIGSGPATPDPSTAAEIRLLLTSLRSIIAIPEFAFRLLDRVERGESPETPKPADPVFSKVVARLIGSNAMARSEAATRARALGYATLESDRLLSGEAAGVGRRLGRLLAEAGPSKQPCFWGGETTVATGARHGLGGRCQELALAAAGELASAPQVQPIVFLAAGTDGRDGPTDAAGAVVDRRTWSAIAAQGIDPVRALTEHNAYPALAASGGLLRTGLTGTNVMDVVIAVAAGAD